MNGVKLEADVKTTEQAERCPACRMFTTNSQPDCRCS